MPIENAEIGNTVHVWSWAASYLGLKTSRGIITNVSRNEDGEVEIVYADFADDQVTLNYHSILTITENKNVR